MVIKTTEGETRRIPVWENIVLIHATSEEEAFEKAERHGHSAEGNAGGSFRWEGKAAMLVFAGIRKLVLCEDAEERPGDGTEITYTELEVDGDESLRKLLASDPVGVVINDLFRTEDSPSDSEPSENGHFKNGLQVLSQAIDRTVMATWTLEAIRHLGGKATILQMCKEVWENHSVQIVGADDFRYVWQFEVRWAADLLRRQGRLRCAKESLRWTWELA